MKTKLITALRMAAKAIETGTIDYGWADQHRCNCGVLACAITGKAPSTLVLPSLKGGLTWGEIVGRHCPITGMPEQETLRAMFEAGLTQLDIIELEELSNPAILKRAGFGERFEKRTIPAKRRFFRVIPEHTVDVSRAVYPKRGYANHVIHYMRAWADILTEQGAMDVAPPEVEHAQDLELK